MRIGGGHRPTRSGNSSQQSTTSVLPLLRPTVNEPRSSTVGCGPSRLPFLLRNRHHQQRPTDATATATARQSPHAINTTPLPGNLEVWAPVTVMHIVRALQAAGLTLSSHVVEIREVHSTVTTVGGVRYIIARRGVTTDNGDARVDWKVERGLLSIHPRPQIFSIAGVRWVLPSSPLVNEPPTFHPGNVSDILQLAWEMNEDPPQPLPEPVTGEVLWHEAIKRNLFTGARPETPTADVTIHRQVRLQWSTGNQHPAMTVFLQMNCPLDHKPAYTQLLSTTRPKPGRGISYERDATIRLTIGQ